jgi:hypothetical protein
LSHMGLRPKKLAGRERRVKERVEVIEEVMK